LVQVTGRVSPAEATLLAQVVRDAGLRAGDGERVSVDVSQCSGAIDLLIPRLLESLRDEGGHVQVSLSGLTQHQRRLLSYLGLQETFEQSAAY
jgi:hypothetical protein